MSEPPFPPQPPQPPAPAPASGPESGGSSATGDRSGGPDTGRARSPGPELAGLLKSTGALILLGLAGKVLGLLVQVLTARYLGVDPSLDAFLVALSLPEMLVQVVMIGALCQVMIPVLAEHEHTRGAESARELSGRILGLIGIVVLAVSLVAGLLSGPLIRLVAPGFDAARHEAARNLFLLMLVNVALGAYIYYGRAGLHWKRHFILAGFSAVAASLAQALAVVFLAPKFKALGLAWATILLNLTTAVIMTIGCVRAGITLRPRWPVMTMEMRKLLGLAWVMGAFLLVSIFSFATDRYFASLLAPGSIAVLGYAWRFEPIFLAVLAGAAAAPVYTELSEAAARGDLNRLKSGLSRGYKLIVLLAFPAAGLLSALAHPLIVVLFQRGAFTAASSREVAVVLSILAPAFACWSIASMLIQALNAMQKPRLTLLIGVVSTVLNLLFDALLYRRFGVAGLALATLAVAVPTTAIMAFGVFRWAGLGAAGPARFTLAVTALSLLAAGAAVVVSEALLSWAAPPLVRLIGGAAAGGGVLVIGSMSLKPPELRMLTDRIQGLLRHGRK